MLKVELNAEVLGSHGNEGAAAVAGYVKIESSGEQLTMEILALLKELEKSCESELMAAIELSMAADTKLMELMRISK